ncbi:hypothetical protein H311_00490 [Anncaliia algerae PRA109]|nr:hypothetical protein H311_00490 [Anncaliia algerae PRA109]
MQIKTIKNKFFTAFLFLTNSRNTKISFEECIEIKSNTHLPHKLLFFKIKENKMFSNCKLKNYNSILKLIEFKFHKEITYKRFCRVLKTFIPTVFDRKTILKENHENDVKDYSEFLLKGIKDIFEENEFLKYQNIYNEFLSDKYYSLSSDTSIISSITDICSDDLINIT